MCGIIGSINLSLDDVHLRMLSHRGPDTENKIETVVNGSRVELGHTRLAIVDLSDAGSQPMAAGDRSQTLVFNGEIYNHLDLRKSLNGHSFQGHSDTESLLHYLIQHGVEASSALNGIFSFAYLDKEKSKLFLVRDPFGVKPLYYFSSGQTLVFSSELRPIQAIVDDDISIENMSVLLRMRYLPAPKTLFKNIRKVKPGHILEIDLSQKQVSISEYSYVTYADKKSTLSFSEALEKYEYYLEHAVKRQLMSDVEIGVLLSGGVDSALIASYAASHTDYKVKAYTVGFDVNSERDEIGYAAETAKYLGLEHIPIIVSEQDFFHSMQEVISAVEEPLATTSMIPFDFLCQSAAKDVKVVLTGQGADEPLGGYRRHQGALMLDILPNRLIKLLPAAALEKYMGEAFSRAVNVSRFEDPVDRLLCSYQVFDTTEIQTLIGVKDQASRESLEYFFQMLHCSSIPSLAEQMMKIDSRLNLADDLLLYTDKISMKYSLECRVPMLDHKLIQFIESLPLKYKRNIRAGKIIHKALAAKTLPSSIVNRKKMGFQSPTDQWFKSSNLLQDVLLDKGRAMSNYFDLQEVEKIINEHKSGLQRERHLFLLLAISFCLENFNARG